MAVPHETVVTASRNDLVSKKFGGEYVISGNIIVRQRGTKIHPGWNVGMGKDHTLFATTEGLVHFETMPGGRKKVHVVTLPEDE